MGLADVSDMDTKTLMLKVSTLTCGPVGRDPVEGVGLRARPPAAEHGRSFFGSFLCRCRTSSTPDGTGCAIPRKSVIFTKI